MREILREQGRALDYPGGAARVSQAVDVDLLARAIAWAGEADAARNDAFNVTNGDVFTWENVWPSIAEALGMQPGKPAPLSLAQEYPKWIAPWNELRRKHEENHDEREEEGDDELIALAHILPRIGKIVVAEPGG